MTYVDPHLAAKIAAYADRLTMTVGRLDLTADGVAGDLRAILAGTYDPDGPTRQATRRQPTPDRCDPAAGTHVDPHRGCILRGQP